MGLNLSEVTLYLACILVGFAVLGLTLIPPIATILGALVLALQIVAIIVILLFTGAIILRGLLTLFGSPRA